ncbi:TPA: XRE family transcriptional regulator [Acinetobacter nosocomialis]|uniref:helix-turn-helix transcriptional regulator n=1 Tax=Acinetobacter nosocomialis TaxID=106654 RepID=UPI0009E12D2F|nr:helix-turn-helix transcriptional regulator [Acinetobacter nosocomialis]ARG15464.1 hypothetical protein B7L44_01890 [Acinetobacter nosocomialis]MBP1470933.1 helix-turn-helix transcriptional regulator [Acinetobacter nosocomialis]MBR7694348.1 helix-turn-helix transcriptional regulator [Acinetobacter nosocomialis]SSR47152.1 Uncharacterised protein [Acinetobacter nosocomialis]HAV4989858.1 XRE family transcriptional regulator [Acinetobacter nosocomialis]
MTVISYGSQYVSTKSKTSFTEICFAGIVGFFGAMGTGSSLNQRDVYEYAAYVVPVDDKKDGIESDKKTSYLSISEQVKIIKDSFGLNMSAMAELLNISRPTIYAWIRGEPPKTQDNISHISFVEKQALLYRDLHLDRPDNFIKRPIFDGESLFSLLREEKQINDYMYTLIKDLDTKESQTRAHGLKKNEIRTSDDILNDLA